MCNHRLVCVTIMGIGRRLLNFYQRALIRQPYLSQAVQTGIIMGTGDFLSQKVVEHRSLREINLERTVKFGAIGFFFEGPILRIWYGVLSKFIGSSGKTVALKKVLADQIIFSPIFYCLFLIIVSFSHGNNWDAIKADLELNYVDVLTASYIVWPWVQLGNFYFVPLQYQVLLVQLFAIFWNTYLAWKTNRVKH